MSRLTVTKIGGKVLNDEMMLADFLNCFASLQGPKVLIHGGGVKATEMADRLSIPSVIKEGRRVTDDQMLEVVTMTYGGLVNRQIVAKLQARGVNAVGLTGADGNIITSNKRLPVDGLDYGWVGDPITINDAFLNGLIEKGIVPVLAPLTHDGKGHLLNTNADTIARSVSVALKQYFQVKLIYAFELPGVLNDVHDLKSIVRRLSISQYRMQKEKGKIGAGMIPKLENAFEAMQSGVEEVVLMKYDQLNNLKNKKFDAYTRLF